MLDRLQELSAQKLERAVRDLVERKFAIARQRSARTMPITGDVIHYDAPPEHRAQHHAQLIDRATKALIARKWFAENEAPPWCGPLPLSQDEITDLLNGPNPGDYRPRMLAGYGQALRNMGWELEHAPTFDLYLMQGE